MSKLLPSIFLLAILIQPALAEETRGGKASGWRADFADGVWVEEAKMKVVKKPKKKAKKKPVKTADV
jgi:hypothetical protein